MNRWLKKIANEPRISMYLQHPQVYNCNIKHRTVLYYFIYILDCNVQCKIIHDEDTCITIHMECLVLKY